MGRIILISAFSGAGKDFFIKGILERFKSFYFSESYTTRKLLERDKDSSKKYKSISTQDFLEKIEQNFFLETGQSHEYFYGTPRTALRQASHEKKDLLLERDVRKAVDLLEEKEFEYGFKAHAVFLWRRFNPLDDFKPGELLSFTQENIRLREPGITDDEVNRRLGSTMKEYLEVKRNHKKFKFIENVEGNLSATLEEFSSFYSPTLWS